MRFQRLAILLFTLGAGVALTLGMLGSCTTTEVGGKLEQTPPAIILA